MDKLLETMNTKIPITMKKSIYSHITNVKEIKSGHFYIIEVEITDEQDPNNILYGYNVEYKGQTWVYLCSKEDRITEDKLW